MGGRKAAARGGLFDCHTNSNKEQEMQSWKSRSPGEKALLELVIVIAISQINRFDVMLKVGTAFGSLELGAVLAVIVAIAGIVLFIAFITHLVQWIRSRGKGKNTYAEKGE